MPNIAIFDLDYTLTKRGTWGRFVVKAVKFRPWLWLPLLVSAGWTQWRYKRGHLPRIRVKQAMMRWSLVGMPRRDVMVMADVFAEREVQKGLRPGALTAIKRHKDAGDVLIIVSAAVDVIVEPIADRLEFDHWLATDMKWDNNRLSGDFASKNCYGPEKVTRLNRLFDDHPELKHSDTIITFYSDSYSDIELLTYSDLGVAVNPDRKLKAIAVERGWDIQDWGK